MYKEVLRSIDGIEIYPIISFVLLGSFFLGVLVYTFTMKKSKVEDMSSLPFNDEIDKD
jgi:cytochrome c oxidase cbb3-type subunit 4